MKALFATALIFAGGYLVMHGLWQIYPPVATIVSGALVLLFGLLIDIEKKPKR